MLLVLILADTVIRSQEEAMVEVLLIQILVAAEAEDRLGVTDGKLQQVKVLQDMWQVQMEVRKPIAPMAEAEAVVKAVLAAARVH